MVLGKWWGDEWYFFGSFVILKYVISGRLKCYLGVNNDVEELSIGLLFFVCF